MAHIVNLCCKDAIDSVSSSRQAEAQDTDSDEDDMIELTTDERRQTGLIAKLRKCVVKIRSSPQRRESFRLQCRVLEKDQLELIRDVSTRWNSTFHMISRALELRPALDLALKMDTNLTRFLLSTEDWTNLERMRDFLQPFKEITVFMSSQKYPTISFNAVAYSTIYAHLNSYGHEHPAWLREAATAAKAKLNKYYVTSDALQYVAGVGMIFLIIQLSSIH